MRMLRYWLYGLLLGILLQAAQAAALTGVRLTTDLPSPQPSPTVITLTAIPTDGTDVMYRFWQGRVTGATVTWTILRDYAAAATYRWTPTAGSYLLEVAAREAATPEALPLEGSTAFTITGAAALAGVAVTATPAAPQPVGAGITLAATPTGGTAPQYQFWQGQETGGTYRWTVLRDFAAAATCLWTPAASGNYLLEVIAREGTSNALFVNRAITYTVSGNTPAPVTAVSLAATPSSPQAANTPITLTASPTGGANLVYRFWLGTLVNSQYVWTLLRDYAATATCPWTPGAGSYIIEVNAREAAAPQATPVQGSLAFTVTGITVAVTPATVTVPAGDTATFTATVTGTANTGVTWSVAAGGAGGTITQAGVYTAPAAGGTDTVLATSAAHPASAGHAVVTVTPPSDDPLGEVALSVFGTRVVQSPLTLHATPYGGQHVRYQFVAGTLTGRTWTWTTVQASSANAACQWTPTVAGTYRLLVWARDDTSGNREFAGEQTVRIRNAGETPPANVAIAPFQANRAAAVSYTFDDGTRNQYRVGVPVFDQYALRATFNIVGHYTPDDAGTGDTASWAEWRMILPRGHEIGNHSLDHLDLTTCTTAQLTTQIESNAQLTAEKLGAAPISFALPHTKGNAAIYQTILRTHVGVRGQQQYVNYGGAGFTAAKANALVDAAIAECRWMVPVLHGVDDTTYMPIGSTVLRDHLAYVQGRDVWVETFGTVSRYVLERDHAMLTVTDEAAHHLTFTITTPLDATLYDVPLTVLVGPLAALPLHVQVYRSGDAALLTTQVTGRAGAYLIQVEVVPGPLPVAVTWE